jgi:hypothetical protein
MLAAAIRKIAPTTMPETMAKNAAVQTLTTLKKAMAPTVATGEKVGRVTPWIMRATFRRRVPSTLSQMAWALLG